MQLLFNLRGRESPIRLVAHGKIKLGGDQVTVARSAFERLAEHALRFARTILIGRIKKRNAVVERRVDAMNRLLARHAARHREPCAETQFRNFKRAAAQFSISHKPSLANRLLFLLRSPVVPSPLVPQSLVLPHFLHRSLAGQFFHAFHPSAVGGDAHAFRLKNYGILALFLKL